MPRRPRLHLPGGIYHVILRGNGRQPVFFDDEDRDNWERILQDALKRHSHRLHAYCWMTNHMHMAIQVNAEPLAGFMRLLASRYGRFLNRKNQRQGHLFERRYGAILVQKDEYLKELLRYIHLNPVRAHMVAKPEDYRWSSHNAYLRLASPEWLTVDYVAAMFGEKERTARRAYADFMARSTPDDTLRLLRNGAPEDDRVLGDDDWIQRVIKNNQSETRGESLNEIIRDACKRHAVTEAELASHSRSRRLSAIRAEIALTATERECATVTEVAKRFGRAHSGLSRAMNRLRDKANK